MEHMESNIGKVCHVYRDKEDFFKHLMNDAEKISRKMEPYMQQLDLRNGYDCEVAIAIATNQLACLTATLECYLEPNIADHIRAVYDFFKKEAVNAIKAREQ